MKKLKRSLALALVACMLCGFLPVGVFAAGNGAPSIDGTSVAPFKQGTGGSNSFRIPALVTLSDGTLVAAADARWNTTFDGGGLDTMVAISKDNGATWTHSFANYLGDNGDAYNGSSSTAFIDPALAVTSNDTIYMLVDLYPYGIALNGQYNTYPNSDIGFNDDGYLKLDYNSAGTYGYYLKDGKIYANGDADPLGGYTVDAYFNVTNENVSPATTTNLFFADSPFHVARTGFLYLTKSTDGGESWSAPQLLNLKNGTERVCLVGPGRGLVTKNGTIVFPVYSYAGDPTNTNAYTEQRLGFIYSTNGTDWQRSENLDYQWASESAVVELNDGTLRFFFRNGEKAVMYVDYNMTAKTWGTPVNTGVASNSNCQVSAISLNHTVDGKQVILVSCPQGATTAGDNDSSGSARLNGKIHLFTVGANNALTKVSTVDVPSVHSANSFMYSCLTAQKDASGNETGDISILYEDQESKWGTGDNCYYQMSFKTFDVEKSFGVTLEGAVTRETVDVSLKVGETVYKTIEGVALNGNNTDTSVATVTWTGSTGEGGTTEVLTPVTLPTSAGSVEAYISDGNGNYLSLSNGTLVNVTDRANATKWTISWHDTPTWHDGTSRYQVKSGSYYVNMVNGVLGVNTSNSGADVNHWYTAENGFYGGYMGTNGWQFNGTSWTINTSGYGNAKAYTLETVNEETAGSTTVTIIGKGVGNTKVEVGNTTYNITVTRDFDKEIDVELHVGETSEIYTDTTGNYENDTNNVAPNAAIATMKVEGSTSTGGLIVTPLTDYVAGTTFYIQTEDGNYIAADGSATADFSKAELWTFAYVASYYVTIRNTDGDYLGDSYSSADIGTSSTTRYLKFSNNQLVGYYKGAVVGTPVTVTTGALIDTTEITFTGVAAGKTTAYVGSTKYNIAVTPAGVDDVVDIELEVGESFTYTDTTGNYVDQVTQEPDGTYATMAVSGSTNYVKVLKEVTALEDGKKYLIVNKGTGQVLSSIQVYVTGQWGDRDALATVDGVSPKSPNFWTVTQAGDGWYVTQNANYLSVAGFVAFAGTTHKNPLTLTYTDNGWTIFDGKTGIDLGHTTTGGYYLVDDMAIDNYTNGAQGHKDLLTNSYWTFYEAVDTAEVESNITNVTFTGLKIGGPVTAAVGNTMYRVTVVALEVDDEIQNIGTNMWNVDPEIQQKAYYSMTNLIKDQYTDASWAPYHQARNEALAKLNEVSGKTYATKGEAEAALAELKELINNLKTAFDALEKAKVITINYQLNGTTILTENYKIDTSATTLPLSDTIVVTEGTKTVAYTINEGMHHEGEAKYENGILTLPSVDTQVNVAVTKLGTLGSGFLGEQVIEGEKDSDGHTQNAGVYGNKVTAMTVTKGITYDLKLADTLTDGQYVVWESDNESVSTVDDNGVVTAVAPGTANIIAKVYNADGSLATINSIPITVHDINYPEGTDTATLRKVGLYIENIDNTTVYCMINGNVDGVFEVIEGHLIYGYYNKSTGDTTDNSTTTAFTFFGDPDEAHALVAMTASDSFGHYSQIHDENGDLGNGEQYYYWTNATAGAGYWQAVGLGTNDRNNPNWEAIRKMVKWAIDHGCDGGQGFTRRQAEGPLCQSLTFISDPMPKIEKAVDGVLPTTRKMADYKRYTEDMVAAVKEQVYFKITVTLEAPTQWAPVLNSDGSIKKENGQVVYRYDENGNRYSAIEYSNSLVADEILPGAFLYTKDLDNLDGKWDGEIDAEFRTQVDDITEELNRAWTPEELAAGKRVLDYYLVYEIQESDIPKFYIDNIANLSYSYKSHYSTGALAAAADAEARISVVGSAIDNVVIDFGQSFTYEGHEFKSYTDGKTYTFEGLTNVHLKGAFVDGEYDAQGNFTNVNADGSKMDSGAAAKYGDVKVYRTNTGELDDKGYPEYIYTVKYTPTAILQGPDAVQIYGIGENDQEKMINGFLVYPATTVYYEEGFMFDYANDDATNKTKWVTTYAAKATGEQTFELLGASQFNDNGELTHKVSNKKYVYGYDPLYTESGYTYGESYAEANAVGANTTFTFTGTGFDLYANCTDESSTETSGYVAVQVKNSDGKTVKMYTVDTVVKGGDTDATDFTGGNEYSLPIVSELGLAHGTYTVTIRKVKNDGLFVRLDGVRIHGTIQEADPSQFAIDMEDHPEFYQLRDYVLHAVNIENVNNKVHYGEKEYDTDNPEYIGYLAGQVYGDISTDSEKPTAVITSVNGIYGGDATAQDLLDNGPKNELFLYGNQTLTFKVTTSRAIQIGLKAPRGETNYSLSYNVDGTTVNVTKEDNGDLGSKSISTSVDMFYELGNTIGTDKEYIISITNTGNDILSITDLKICDDPNAAFVPLTEEDIEQILKDSLGVEQVPEEPEIVMPFVDVPEDSFYYESVLWAVKEGITNGVTPEHFGPDANCNRAQVVTFLWRAAGSPEPNASKHSFVDVESGSFYEKAVLWAVEKGITNGTDATHFSPNLECNRAQVVTFLYRAGENTEAVNAENPFSDVPAESWYTDAVLWAVENGITNGMGGGVFGVENICNRAQIVTFLYRAHN